jgi:hypothetical protein
VPSRAAFWSDPAPLSGAPVGDRLPWLWLGTHQVHWLGTAGVPLFVSRRRLARIRPVSWPVAAAPWALDSGAFTELNAHGGWSITAREYAAFAREASERIGSLAWVAPMDAPCEPGAVAAASRTGALARALGRSAPRGVLDHQVWSVRNFLELRSLLGRPGDPHVIPVLQGWTLPQYVQCAELFAMAGVDLAAEPLVGVGSVCRRDASAQILSVLGWLGESGITRLHGFGVKNVSVSLGAHRLASADSMAWSYAARRAGRPLVPGHVHSHCGNCLETALVWRERALSRLRSNVDAIHEGLAVVEGWIADGSWADPFTEPAAPERVPA